MTFQTRQEIDAYLAGLDDGAKLECLVCHRAFVALGVHVAHKHGLSQREYTHEFGLPAGIKLVAPSLKTYLSAAAKTPERIARALAMLPAARATARRPDRRELVTATKATLRDRSAAMVEEPPDGHIMRLNLVAVEHQWSCSRCGKPALRAVPVSTVLAGRLKHCDECRRWLTNRRPRSAADKQSRRLKARERRAAMTEDERTDDIRRRTERKRAQRARERETDGKVEATVLKSKRS